MGDQRKGGQKGTPTLGAVVPTGFFRSSMLDARERRKFGPRCGVTLHRRDRDGKGSVLSSHNRNGGSYKRMDGIGKG